jgi:hypothetical protein
VNVGAEIMGLAFLRTAIEGVADFRPVADPEGVDRVKENELFFGGPILGVNGW